MKKGKFRFKNKELNVKDIFGYLLVVIFVFAISIVSVFFGKGVEAADTTIQFKDKNMYDAMKRTIGESKIQSYDDEKFTITITNENISNIEELNISQKNIVDISGIENFTNITKLSSFDNQINDISLLSRLTKLKSLYLTKNKISDISALSGLEELTNLELTGNQISDISPLKDLTNLTTLSLSYNNISNISDLGGLTNLTKLCLGNNQINDISSLSNLKNLTELELGSFLGTIREANKINDISALSGLTKLTKLNLSGNQISDISPLKNLTNLTKLYLGSNDISDTIPVGTKTYNLPSIITGVQNNNEQILNIYNGSKDLFLVNCKLSKNKKSIILDDGLKEGDEVSVTVHDKDFASLTKLVLTVGDSNAKSKLDKVNNEENNKEIGPNKIGTIVIISSIAVVACGAIILTILLKKRGNNKKL